MKNNIINFKVAAINVKLNKFSKHGILDESLYYKDGTEYHIRSEIKNHCDPDLITEINKKLKVKRTSEFILYTNQFEDKLENLKESFKTHHHNFKFPSILRKYRKGINPVTALYNELQEALFLYNASNDYYVWVISLFKNKAWTESLLTAIEHDIVAIKCFLNEHTAIGTKLYKDDIGTIQNIQKNLAHYYEVFSLMEQWDTKF